MPDPNVQAAKGIMTSMDEANACYEMGLLPLVPHSVHSQLINRWNVEHVIAPHKRIFQQTDQQTDQSTRATWRPYVWAHAWVVALFYNSNLFSALSNGWSSQQQNKPAVLRLKIAYDAGLTDANKRIAYMTEFILGSLPHVASEHRNNFHSALRIAMNSAQKELNDD